MQKLLIKFQSIDGSCADLDQFYLFPIKSRTVQFLKRSEGCQFVIEQIKYLSRENTAMHKPIYSGLFAAAALFVQPAFIRLSLQT